MTAANIERRTPNAERRIRTGNLLRSMFDIRRSMFGVYINLVVVFLLAGCADTTPPAVTPEMAARTSSKPLTVAQLQHGRRLFASRCIECHTLPVVTAHEKTEWPCLVDWMAKRASLKPEEREAMIAYLVAARSQDVPSQ